MSLNKRNIKSLRKSDKSEFQTLSNNDLDSDISEYDLNEDE